MILELNEYVRTKNGIISKVIGVQSGGIEKYFFDKEVIDNFKELTQIGAENVVAKHSFNIIDLIEVGDYVNGSRVIEVNKDKETGYVSVEYSIRDKDEIMLALLYDEDSIKSIVTKEQFKTMEYEVK